MRKDRSGGPSAWKARAHLLALGSMLACGGGLACGGEKEETRRRLAELREKVTSLQADQDRLEERLAAVEHRREAPPRGERRRDPVETERLERPRLKVIRLAPDGETPALEPPPAESPGAGGTDPDPAAPRPVIRGQGDRIRKIGDSDGSALTPQSAMSPGVALAAALPRHVLPALPSRPSSEEERERCTGG